MKFLVFENEIPKSTFEGYDVCINQAFIVKFTSLWEYSPSAHWFILPEPLTQKATLMKI